MKIYLAGEHICKNGRTALQNRTEQNRTEQSLFILESFYYCQNNVFVEKLMPFYDDFLLDSGAFTFRTNIKNQLRANWDEYVELYADYVNQHNVQKFIEMDIDTLVGLNEVERLRRKLELLTNKQSIPVWHFNRGVDYFKKMVDEYNYVAIATTPFGIEGRTFRKHENLIPYFINMAHKNGAKIHGLGYTATANLRKFRFDSVDSTAWLYGNRGGFLYQFDVREPSFFRKIQTGKGQRLKPAESAEHNFNEWRKFQQYAERYL